MADNSISDQTWIFDKQIMLFKRTFNGTKSENWHAKIKVPSRKGNIRISTRTRSLKAAERIAIEYLREAEGRVQIGLPLRQVKFSRASDEYSDWLLDQKNSHQCSERTYRYHLQVIEKSLRPYFQDEYLHNIDGDKISAYQGKRKNLGSNYGQPVSKGTINKNNAVIRGIFKYAKRKRYIYDLPEIRNLSAFARRPSFSTKEAEILRTKLDEWISFDNQHVFDGSHVLDYRKLFRFYCLTIFHSGIRPGKEMSSLRWEDVVFKENKYGGYVILVVKTAKQKSSEIKLRTVIALPDLWQIIEEIKGTELYHEEGFIFAHPKTTQLEKQFIGKPIKNFRMQWNHFINWSGLEHEKKPPYRKRTLYSLRHLYVEQMLINSDVGLIALATNCGTSPEVLSKWYHEVESEDYAEKLSRIIKR